MTTFMRDPPGGDAHKALEEERHIMSAYSDTAKTYSQLSLGALVLSVTFFEKVAKGPFISTSQFAFLRREGNPGVS